MKKSYFYIRSLKLQTGTLVMVESEMCAILTESGNDVLFIRTQPGLPSLQTFQTDLQNRLSNSTYLQYGCVWYLLSV